MKGINHCRPMVVVLAWVALTGSYLIAGDVYKKDVAKPDSIKLPKPADVIALEVRPKSIALKGADDAQQLLVTASLADKRLQDLSGDVQYEVADEQIVRVTSAGRVIPLANGNTEITVSYGDKSLKIPVAAESCDVSLPI